MFYFKIENLRIRILKGASALYCKYYEDLKDFVCFYYFNHCSFKEKGLPFFYVYAFFGVGKESFAFSVCTAAGQNSSS